MLFQNSLHHLTSTVYNNQSKITVFLIFQQTYILPKMKAVLCLVFLAVVACAMAAPTDPIVSEAKLAIQSNSDLLTYGNGLYHPVNVVDQEYRVVVPIKELVVEKGVREIVLEIV